MLQSMTNTSFATDDFPFMRSKWIELSGVKVLALRVSFTGDLGWELHCATADQDRLYAALLETGKAFGAGPVGKPRLDEFADRKRVRVMEPRILPRILASRGGLGSTVQNGQGFPEQSSGG